MFLQPSADGFLCVPFLGVSAMTAWKSPIEIMQKKQFRPGQKEAAYLPHCTHHHVESGAGMPVACTGR